MTTSPADDLARRAATAPHATALSWDGGRMTYRELDLTARAAADRLHAATCPEATADPLAAADPFAATASRAGAHFPPGSLVTLRLSPGPDAVAMLLGVWKAGHVAVPLHERLTAAEVTRALQIVNSTLHIDNSGLHFGPLSAVPAGVIAFLLTSGSSGAPKALGFTRAAFAASASAVTRRLGLTADDRWGLCLSLGHVGGLSLVVRAVMNGSAVRLWPSFDARAVVRSILDGEVTHLAIVPVMLRKILECLRGERVPASLRCVLVGGAAAPRALLDEAWRAGLPIATTWGMTETASQVATAPPELARRLPGTVGRPLHGVEVRTEPGGNLSVRGPTLASAVIRGPGTPPEALETDAGGWFATRDLGRIDENGLVWIEGREDAIIVSGGLNVSPREVERVIEGLPGVVEAVVFGVPDEEWGEVVVAVVERDRRGTGAAEGPSGDLTAADVDRHCRESLVRGRCPSHIVVVDELPRTWTGKVMRAGVVVRFGTDTESLKT